METIIGALQAAAGIVIIMSFWMFVQYLVRKRSGCSADHDVLEYMAHGCGACDRSKSCQKKAAVPVRPSGDRRI